MNTATLLLLPLFFVANIAGVYATSFPTAENPLSENGAWIGGKTVGLDWADVATEPGRA